MPEDWAEQISIMHDVLKYVKEERQQDEEAFEYVIMS